MVDIHAHILPGIDDGAKDLDHALEMADLAVESGVTILVTTPHCNQYRNPANLWDNELIKHFRDFQAELKKADIPLTIVPGMEIYGTEDTPLYLRDKQMIGLNGSNYPLIEFPFRNYGGQATDILEEVVALGMVPIVAHPERYLYVQDEPGILNLWAEMGCLFQVNKGSLLGRFGRQEQRLGMELIRRNFAFAVASDAHTPTARSTWMADVEELISEEFSPDMAKRLLETNPLRILKNEKIHRVEPYWFR